MPLVNVNVFFTSSKTSTKLHYLYDFLCDFSNILVSFRDKMTINHHSIIHSPFILSFKLY